MYVALLHETYKRNPINTHKWYNIITIKNSIYIYYLMPHAKCNIYEDGRNKGRSCCHRAFCCIAKKTHSTAKFSLWSLSKFRWTKIVFLMLCGYTCVPLLKYLIIWLSVGVLICHFSLIDCVLLDGWTCTYKNVISVIWNSIKFTYIIVWKTTFYL